MRTGGVAVAFTLASMLLAGCTTNVNSGDTVVFTFTNLPPLGVAVVYEAWVELHDDWVSVGKFIVRTDSSVVSADGFKRYGNVSHAAFEKVKDGRDAAAILVTIEPGADPSPLPSNHRLMYGVVGGQASRREATLSQGGVALPEMRFASGGFTLITPTDDVNDPKNNTANNESGLWFYKPADPRCGSEALPACTTLNVPELPTGWKYEGWIEDTAVTPAKYYAMGKFRAPFGRDEDAASTLTRGKGSLGPPFPGQDFVNATLDVPVLKLNSGRYRAFISVELDPDNNPDPFFLKPLSASLPAGITTAPFSHDMDSGVAKTFPRGKAEIEREGLLR